MLQSSFLVIVEVFTLTIWPLVGQNNYKHGDTDGTRRWSEKARRKKSIFLLLFLRPLTVSLQYAEDSDIMWGGVL